MDDRPRWAETGSHGRKVRSDVIQDVNLTWNSQSMDSMNHFYIDDFRV